MQQQKQKKALILCYNLAGKDIIKRTKSFTYVQGESKVDPAFSSSRRSAEH